MITLQPDPLERGPGVESVRWGEQSWWVHLEGLIMDWVDQAPAEFVGSTLLTVNLMKDMQLQREEQEKWGDEKKEQSSQLQRNSINPGSLHERHSTLSMWWDY